ncbi:MAG TPA: thioredoxin family protein [Ktedonobacterales bacterium]|nr:thioredoxin family protein [Ktedonobacterales bacterium]
MNPELARAGIILALGLAIGTVIGVARWLIEQRRKRVLATAPALDLPTSSTTEDAAPVRILVFSSDDCAQCHRLQAPAVQKVLAARGPAVTIVAVDAPSSPELTERYQILTLPSTAILDASGKTHAINYGFANSTKLLRQIDDVLASKQPEVTV